MGAFKYAVMVLGVLYTAAGIAKLLPAGSVHEFMTKGFVKYTTVFPLIRFGFKPDPAHFQFAVGIVETVGGLLLLFGSLRLKKMTAVPLLVIMMGAAWTLHQLDEPISQVAFPVLCGTGLVVLLTQSEEKPKTE
ncbi:transmembrane protein 35B-like [Ptychodera flava]|uniref:transmembrane protein 35B-like n=1 Tax=Ptychodera flava TaxID=63121 RepID=UPI003969D962